ncbi:hypothetical protein ASG11_04600 [Sphingomonas sp. Leaf357]|uniref:hypothetical protein n=1 Tax=Sphingomonas sp. Leaf357 TaxID=1736350 RepID=UPI000700460F|nr:hypothetical protein [Sphingomonas sp. Leaf357]KQS03617.1 hypothetical protein ASG11_04600 [Sphingomonas sp. Leaf357]
MVWAAQKAARERAKQLLILALALLPTQNDLVASEIRAAIEMINDSMVARDPQQIDLKAADDDGST